MMLISIDHGNKNTKTASKVSMSGLHQSTTKPYGSDVLEYRGNFYTISDTRIPYMRDKTLDNRFYILTLFAIAYEMEARGFTQKNMPLDVQFLIGLPPAHFGLQREGSRNTSPGISSSRSYSAAGPTVSVSIRPSLSCRRSLQSCLSTIAFGLFLRSW